MSPFGQDGFAILHADRIFASIKSISKSHVYSAAGGHSGNLRHNQAPETLEA